MAHFVYTDNGQPVPASVRVFELPEGGWVAMEDGKRRTVTSVKDEADASVIGIAPPQDPRKFLVCDLTPALKEQLTRIEELLNQMI